MLEHGPEWAHDVVYVDTTIVLKWHERLRILLQGRMHCDSRTFVDGQIHRNHTVVNAWFEPLPWKRKPPVAYVAYEKEHVHEHSL